MRLRLKDLREDKDMTQKEIANLLHCDQSLYSKFERGEREISLSKVMELSFFYNTSIDYLVGITNVKNPYERV